MRRLGKLGWKHAFDLHLRYTVAISLLEYSDIIGKRPGRCTVMQNGAEVKEPIRTREKKRSLWDSLSFSPSPSTESASDMLVRLVRS